MDWNLVGHSGFSSLMHTTSSSKFTIFQYLFYHILFLLCVILNTTLVAPFVIQSLWLYFSDTFGRPTTGRREQRNYSATSDQGTGDEATLPRTEERPVKKKSGIRRSRSTTRNNQSSTPNVPTQPNKKQLFSGRKSSEKGALLYRERGGRVRRSVTCLLTKYNTVERYMASRKAWKVNWSTWHERGTMENSECPTGIEPKASRTLGGALCPLSYENSWRA